MLQELPVPVLAEPLPETNMSKKTVIKFAVPVLLAIVLQQVVGGGLGSIFNSAKSSAPEEPEEGTKRVYFGYVDRIST